MSGTVFGRHRIAPDLWRDTFHSDLGMWPDDAARPRSGVVKERSDRRISTKARTDPASAQADHVEKQLPVYDLPEPAVVSVGYSTAVLSRVARNVAAHSRDTAISRKLYASAASRKVLVVPEVARSILARLTAADFTFYLHGPLASAHTDRHFKRVLDIVVSDVGIVLGNQLLLELPSRENALGWLKHASPVYDEPGTAKATDNGEASAAEWRDAVLAAFALTTFDEEMLDGAREAMVDGISLSAALTSYTMPTIKFSDDGVLSFEWKRPNTGVLIVLAGGGTPAFSVMDEAGLYSVLDEFSLNEELPTALRASLTDIGAEHQTGL